MIDLIKNFFILILRLLGLYRTKTISEKIIDDKLDKINDKLEDIDDQDLDADELADAINKRDK
jgi:F0F1-type ATP synthase membrane subunit b/b'